MWRASAAVLSPYAPSPVSQVNLRSDLKLGNPNTTLLASQIDGRSAGLTSRPQIRQTGTGGTGEPTPHQRRIQRGGHPPPSLFLPPTPSTPPACPRPCPRAFAAAARARPPPAAGVRGQRPPGAAASPPASHTQRARAPPPPPPPPRPPPASGGPPGPPPPPAPPTPPATRTT